MLQPSTSQRRVIRLDDCGLTTTSAPHRPATTVRGLATCKTPLPPPCRPRTPLNRGAYPFAARYGLRCSALVPHSVLAYQDMVSATFT